MPVNSTPTYLPSLTSLRFVAAALVVISHSYIHFGYGTWLAHRIALDQGVSFFFVLSGFILFYNNGKMESLSEAGRFVAARIARIWPVHMATLLIMLAFIPGPWGLTVFHGPLLANVFLVHSWIPYPIYFFGFNSVSWSLSTEFFFYLMFPILALNWRRTWHVKVLLCALLAYGMIAFSEVHHLKPFDGRQIMSIDGMVYICPLARLLEFALGMLAAHLWLCNRTRLARISWGTGTAVEIAALVLVFFSMTKLLYEGDSLSSRGVISLSALRWWSSSGSAPAFALMTVAFAMQCGLISKLLSWRPFVILGEISFSLYMCHQLLFKSLIDGGMLGTCGSLLTQYVIYWGFCIAFAYALYRLVETPCRKAVLRFLISTASRLRGVSPEQSLRSGGRPAET